MQVLIEMIKLKNLWIKIINYYTRYHYQHFTNSIENWFSMLKARLRKLEGLRYEEIKENVKKVLNSIPKEHYKNIIEGAYERELKPSEKESRANPLKNYL